MSDHIMGKKQSKTRTPVKNVSKTGGQIKGKPIAKAATNMELLVIVFLIAFAGGFGFYGALRAANTSGLSIGTAATQNSFGVGTWFRYDDNVASNTTGVTGGGGGFYLIANITSITTTGNTVYGDPMAAAVLGSNARWYVWEFTIFNKATNAKAKPSVKVNWFGIKDVGYRYSVDWSCFYQYLINGYSNRSLVTPAKFVYTDSYNVTRPMFVNYGSSYASTVNSIQVKSQIFSGYNTGIYAYVNNKSALIYPYGPIVFAYSKQGVATGYDPDTGILLWMKRSGIYLTLTAFSVSNPMAYGITKPPSPQYQIVNTVPSSLSATNWVISVTNYDATTTYEMAIMSSDQSVVKSAPFGAFKIPPIQFATPTYNLNVLKFGTTTVSIYLRCSQYGIYSNYTNSTVVFNSASTGIPTQVTTVPSSPVVTVTSYNGLNGTAFLSWTASGGFPSTYQIWVYHTDGANNFQNTGQRYPWLTIAGNYNSIGWWYYLYTTVSASITKCAFYNLRGVNGGGYFVFVVTAINSIGSSPMPAIAPKIYLGVKAVLVTPIKPPSFSATIDTAILEYCNVTLSWKTQCNATSFNIYRRENITFTVNDLTNVTLLKTIPPGVPINPNTAIAYVDKLPPTFGMTYYYAVMAVNQFGTNMTDVKSVIATNKLSYWIMRENTTVPTPKITVTPRTSNDGFITMNWTTAPLNPSYGLAKAFNIYMFDSSLFTYNLTIRMPDNSIKSRLMTPILISKIYNLSTTSVAMRFRYPVISGIGLRCFAVLAENRIGLSAFNFSSAYIYTGVNITAKAIVTKPFIPATFTASIVNGKKNSNVSLSWSASANATKYNVYRQLGSTFDSPFGAQLIAVATGTSYVDKFTITTPTNIYYAVSAQNLIGESQLSIVRMVNGHIVTSKPPTINLTKASDTSVNWSVIPNAVNYALYMNNGTVFYKNYLLSNITAFEFNGYLPNGVWNISVTVITVDDNYEGNHSNAIIITITDTPMANLTYATESVPVTQPFDYTTLAIPIILGIVVVIAVILVWNRRKKLFNKAPSSTAVTGVTKSTAPPTAV